MASTTQQTQALRRRREALIARFSAPLEALAAIDVARDKLDKIAARRARSEQTAREKIAKRYDPQEAAARREIATNLRDAREVISVKDITAETGLSSDEQHELLALLDAESAPADEAGGGHHEEGDED